MKSTIVPTAQPPVIGAVPPPIVWLEVDRIDPSPAARNSRWDYNRSKMRELADSIREHGILEPILVTPVGDRFEVVAGNRRLHAAMAAGFDRVPAVVRSDLDERRRLLVNLVENAQRLELSPSERIAAVRRLAEAGLGVREIARGTGLSPGTVSRWVRIAENGSLQRALEEGRIDLFRAMHLVGINDACLVEELIAVASDYSPEAFYELVQQRVAGSNTAPDRDERRLALIAERLTRMDVLTPAARESLRRITLTASALLDRSSSSGAVQDQVDGRSKRRHQESSWSPSVSSNGASTGVPGVSSTFNS